MTLHLDLHYRHLRARRAIKGAIERAAQWVLRDWACACCGLVTPKADLQDVPDHGLLCHACLVGRLRGHFATLEDK
jgi:hypothetical protein